MSNLRLRQAPGWICVSAFAIALVLASAVQGEEAVGEDEALRDRIEAKLEGLPEREGAEIRVAVRDGRVLLQGSVRLLEQSLRAERATWKTDGVIDVENELRVVRAGPIDDSAIERQVRKVLEADGRFVDTKLELDVVAGLVRLRGLFEDPADLLTLKHRIASIPGVLGVEIDAILVARRTASIAALNS